MRGRSALLEVLGGEEGCKTLSTRFYARVGKDPVLRPFFPGQSLRCATEEFAAFLIQFLGGDEKQTQHRWWLSLRESHARFRIGPHARSAWLKHMEATLDAAGLNEGARSALRQFFLHSSAYVIGRNAADLDHEELAARWNEQRVLDSVIEAIEAGRDHEVLSHAPRFSSRPSVFVGLLARMIKSGRAGLIQFVIDAAKREPSLVARCFAGSTLLHYAAGAGCLEVVTLLLRLGADPNIQDRGEHTPLYCVANECASKTGPEVVLALVRAGAEVNARGGVTRATALHMAARRGHVEIARALLDSGAAVNARDRKGDTPRQRAINCRKNGVSQLLLGRGPDGTMKTEWLRFNGAVERDPAIDAWMEEHAGELGAIAHHWFEVMRKCGDEVRELLHDGYPVACLGDAPFGYVSVFASHVNVGFFHGAALPDPARLLQGAGKFMRHVKLRPGTATNAQALCRLIDTAYLDIKARIENV